MKLKNLYYVIWSDIIVRYKISKPYLKDRRIEVNLLFLISSINAINIWVVLLWLQILNVLKIDSLNFNILPTERLNNGISFFVQYVLPCIFLNYIFIFRKKRYLKLVEKYSTTKNNYGNIYISTVLIICVISAFIHGIITGNIFKI